MLNLTSTQSNTKRRGRPSGKYGHYKSKTKQHELVNKEDSQSTTPRTNQIDNLTFSRSTLDNAETKQNTIKTIADDSVNYSLTPNLNNKVDNIASHNTITRRAILEVSHLKKRYKNNANYIFEDLSFTITEGEIVGILGENGAGKSTLLKCITGLTPIDHGAIKVCNIPLEEARDEISVLWVEAGMHASYTVRNNMYFWCTLYDIPYDEHLIIALFDKFGVGGLLDRPFKLLSTGQKRKICIARTFLKKAALYILDEATSGLDFASQANIQTFIKTHVAEQNSTFLFVTHLYTDLLNLCTKIMLIDSGRLIDYCTVKELHKKYLSGVVVTLLLDTDDEAFEQIKSYLTNKNVPFVLKRAVARLKTLCLKLNKEQDYAPHETILKPYILTKNTDILTLDLFVTLLMQGVIFAANA